MPVIDLPDGVETLDQIATDLFANALGAIRDEIVAIRNGRGVDDGDPTLRVGKLTVQAAQIVAQQRQLAKLEQRGLREITPASVLSWVRLQTPEYRATLVKQVVAVDQPRKSVLG